MAHLLGRTISHYRLTELLGSGGMGEVYRAHDSELGRDVAIKVLPEAFADDEHRLGRLRQEARSLAALNHPHVASVFGFEEHDGTRFIVMELVEGDTLAERLRKGTLPVEKAFDYGVQIARALEAAHERGIIHRDLKPSNVKITPAGTVKVLDFGLAKTLRAEAEGDSESELPTATVGATRSGTILGTAAYMSPEQARGEQVDKRTDIWAFGCVLYEMVTGRRAFDRQTPAETLAAVLERRPEWSALPAATPVPVGSLLRRCLRRDPSHRLHDIADARIEIEEAVRELAEPREVTASPDASTWQPLQESSAGRLPAAAPPDREPRASWWRTAAWVVGSLAVVALGGLSVWWAMLGWGVGDSLPAAPPPPGSATERPSIAVLPLDNHGPPEQEYFADGMTEALTSHLAKIEALKVISRTSVMQYRDAPKSIPRIATELGLDEPVRWIVEGSVQRAGDRVRITAQLIDAPADRHVWVESYDRDVRDVLALQSDVARAIAGEIRVRITPQDESRIAEDRRIDPEAHDAYIRGLHHHEEALRAGFARDSFDRAVEFFQKAIEIEPLWAKAHGQLGSVYHFIASSRSVTDQREFYPKAKTALLRALELDDELAQAHASLGFVLVRHERDWSGASREYRRARELDPNHDPWGYALFLLAAGRLDEAISEYRISRELNPQVPGVQLQLTWALRCAGRLEEAAQEARTAIELYPERPEVYYDLAETLIAAGSYEDAIEAVQEGLALTAGRTDEPSWLTASQQGRLQLAYAYAKAGRATEAREILGRMEAGDQVPALMALGLLPDLLLALGETERALGEIERRFAERDEGLLFIRCSLGWKELRELPRVREIVRQIGFPAGDLASG